MGRADFWASGDWNSVCYECGRKRKSSQLKKHWQGYFVCPEHWEARQPQDFVRGVQDVQTVPWSQPYNDVFLNSYCTLSSRGAMPGQAGPGCCIPGTYFPET